MSIQLNLEQEEIYNKLIEKIDKFNVSLIVGVTGSGKTLIFLKVINFLLNQVQLSFAKTKISPICSKLDGVQILIMIPEISLTESLIEKIKTLCSIEPIVWHSSISAKKKKEIFNKILANETNIILGARSALFLPYKNLKLIIVDEEHDSSYKQNEYPVYNAKNTAITIAKYKNILLLISLFKTK